MGTQQKAIIGVIVIIAFVFFSAKSSNGLTNEDAQATIATVNECFDKAEEKVFGNKPDNPDTPSGPDPDPEKCICQGTGKIIQGDGHVTPCPYHSEPDSNGTPALEPEQQFYRTTPRRRIFGNLFGRCLFIN